MWYMNIIVCGVCVCMCRHTHTSPPLFLKDFYFMLWVFCLATCDYIHAEPTEAQKRASNPPRTELFVSCGGGTRNIKHWPSGKAASTLSH